MDKIYKFKDGCLVLKNEGIEISKNENTRFYSYNIIKELQIAEPTLFRRGVLNVVIDDDNETYIPLLKKSGTITYGYSDTITIARLRYKIEKSSNIEIEGNIESLSLSIKNRLKLINPFLVLISILIVSFCLLNRTKIFSASISILKGDLALLLFNGNNEMATGFLIGIILGCLLLWYVLWITSNFSAKKTYNELKRSGM